MHELRTKRKNMANATGFFCCLGDLASARARELNSACIGRFSRRPKIESVRNSLEALQQTF